MNKKFLYAVVFSAALVACSDDDYTDWSQPQSNPQEQTITFGNGSVTTLSSAVDLRNVEGETVLVCNISAPTASAEGYTPAYKITLSAEGSEVAPATFEISNEGYMKTAELKDYLESIYGKRPVERTLKAVLSVWQNSEAGSIRMDEISFDLVAITKAPNIESAYYITGTINGWDNTDKTYVLSNGGADVYENPVFTLTLPASAVPADATSIEFKVTPESGIGGDWSGCLCAAEEEGKFVDQNAGGNFVVAVDPSALFYAISFNMLDMTWSANPLSFAPYVYVPGNAQGWDPSKAGRLYSADCDGIYTGFIYVDGGFKLTSQADWNGTNYGVGAAECTVSATGGDFNWGTGVFYVSLNLQDLSYTATKVEKMGLIGDFNSWGDDVELTWNAAKSCYEGDASAVTAAGWKFRVNADWAINLGGKSLADLVADGANLKETGSKIELFPLRLNGVSETIYGAMDGNTPIPPTPGAESSEYLWTPGNANGWGHAAASRIYSAEKDGCYEGFIYVNGEFKFSDEASWSGTNFGAGEEGKLSTDGGAGNLNLEEGVYYVTVDINALTYTATKIEMMSMIGDFNGWSADEILTWNADNLCFEGDASGVTAAGWKFRANGGWDINLGGTVDNLVVNGDNLSVTGSTVKLYPCRVGENNNIYCTVE